MPWINSPNYFKTNNNQVENHTQVFGIGAHKKNEVTIYFSAFHFSDLSQGFQLYNDETHLILSWRKEYNLHVILFVYQEQVNDFLGNQQDSIWSCGRWSVLASFGKNNLFHAKILGWNAYLDIKTSTFSLEALQTSLANIL